MGHGTARVVLQGLLKALDRKFVIIGVRPDKPRSNQSWASEELVEIVREYTSMSK